MLRITAETIDADRARLRLEGRLLAESVPVVQEAWRTIAVSSRVDVDLGGLLFADDQGVACLRELLARASHVEPPGSYLSQRLQEQEHLS